MRQTVKNRMIKNVQMMAVGMMATASIMGTAAAMGVKMDNIPFNVLAYPFQAVMTQGVAATTVESGACGDNATFVLDSDGTLTISGTGAINGNTFQTDMHIQKVIINEGITQIEDDTFLGYWTINEISLPEGLESIGDRAFGECTALKSVTIPGTVKKLGNTVGSGPFEQCTSLESVVIEEGVPYIGYQAFTGCSNLTNISIPSSVTSIGGQAFQQCTNLASVTLPEGLNYLGGSAFLYQGITQIDIPDGVTVIETSVFDCCDKLETVQMGDSVTQIKDYAFRQCTGLKQIKLSDNITTIGIGAFNNCNKLESITLPSKLQYVGELAFASCKTIKEVYIPDSTTFLGDRAFQSCNSMTRISGMKGIENISKGTFRANIEFPAPNYTEVRGEPLTTVLDTTNEYVLNYDWLNNENRKLGEDNPSCGPDATYKEDDTKVTITGTGAIDDEAFKDNDTVTEVVIEEGITEIGNQSFENMDNLETVIIPDSVTNIGDQAFAENPNLEVVQGGDNATIADNAFDCTTPNTVIKTDNENVYNNIKDNTDREAQLANSIPISPVEENWLYSSDDKTFITDKVQIGSVVDDFESLLDDFATVVGLDEKQGVKQTYEAADANSEDTTVYCTKASDWIITIPKDLVMSGDDESQAEYIVGVYGNVDPAKRVTVTPDASFEMINTGNPDVKYTAQVSQPVTGINGIDIAFTPAEDTGDASQMSGSITANLKRAGSYRGTMTFTVDYVDHT